MSGAAEVVVIGQLARDIVLTVEEMPRRGATARVGERRELLGGKGANQAVGLAQLGARPTLVAVVGRDQIGEDLMVQVLRDGVATDALARRGRTALIVDLVDGDGHWRYLADIPEESLVTPADIQAAAPMMRGADWVAVQMQQPVPAVHAAVDAARAAGCRILFDGAPDPALLAEPDVLRADAREAELILGRRLESEKDGLAAARTLQAAGPSIVALAVEDVGDIVAWPDGHLFLPLGDAHVVDTTGAGDAYVAAFLASLLRDPSPEAAARRAAAASAATVSHPGGRPDLTGSPAVP